MYDALVAPERCRDQAELLERFDLPIALMQDAEALERIAYELVETKAADNVRYVEVRWGPLLHVARGLSLADGIAAVVRGTRAAADRFGVTARLIATALRSHDPADNVTLAETAAGFRSTGLVGFDLAGQEAAFPDPLVHAASFAAARAGGLRITLHAGEWGGAAQVRRALAVEPERIAHGPGAVDDPALCRELSSAASTLDLCPTSNVQAGIVPSVEEHPLARLHRAGVPVTLSTDDLTVSDISLSDEYVRAVRADRAAPDGAVGDRPARARRRVRRAGGAGAGQGGVRRVRTDRPRGRLRLTPARPPPLRSTGSGGRGGARSPHRRSAARSPAAGDRAS